MMPDPSEAVLLPAQQHAPARAGMTAVPGKRPMILEIGNRWFPEHPGGLERYHYELARHLPACGFAVENFVVAAAGEDPRASAQATAYAGPGDPMMTRLRALRRAVQMRIRRGDVSLIACHYPLYGLPLYDLLRTIPTIFHFHGPWAAEGRIEGNPLPAWLAKRGIEHLLYPRGAGFIVLSNAFAEILHRSYGVSRDKIHVIPGGVDTVRFHGGPDRMAARRTLGLPCDRRIILSIRRLSRRMGLENLIDAMRAMAQRYPDLLLLIGGAGPLKSLFDERIATHRLEKNVRLLGRLPDEQLPLLYRAADVSVVPSVALEGFGLTAAESLACGTPVLVTAVGGLPEVVRGLSHDLVLSSPEPAALAEGIVAFFEGNLAIPDDAACADYACRTFAWPVIARQAGSAYAKLLANV